MTSEKFKPWHPVANAPHRLTVNGLRDEDDGLEISLKDADGSGQALLLRFSDVVAYRVIDESYRLQTWAAIATPGLPSLLTVDNSHWIAWLEVESGRVLEEYRVVHYAIFTGDDCIDVVAKSEPEAIWIRSTVTASADRTAAGRPDR